jgi:hypothetical protein
MVILGVENETDLQIYATAANNNKQPNALFYEPDINAYTALATIPENNEIYKHLKLL